MDLMRSLDNFVVENAPCIALAVRVHEDAVEAFKSGAGFCNSIDHLSGDQIISAFASLKHLYSLACQQYADRVGVPVNELHSCINERLNRMVVQEREV